MKRVAIAEEEGTTVLAVGGKPGEAFTPSGWEWTSGVEAAAGRGDRHDAEPGSTSWASAARAYYQLACFEAKAGRTAEARAHLRSAIELDPVPSEIAEQDDDLKEVL